VKKLIFGQKKWAFGHFQNPKVGRKIVAGKSKKWLKRAKNGLKVIKNDNFMGVFKTRKIFWSNAHLFL